MLFKKNNNNIHWNIAYSYGLHVSNKWYEHKPEGVIENDHVKLFWDFKGGDP